MLKPSPSCHIMAQMGCYYKVWRSNTAPVKCSRLPECAGLRIDSCLTQGLVPQVLVTDSVTVPCRRRCCVPVSNVRRQGSWASAQTAQTPRASAVEATDPPPPPPWGSLHHTLTLRREPPRGQLHAAHGMKMGDARDKWHCGRVHTESHCTMPYVPYIPHHTHSMLRVSM